MLIVEEFGDRAARRRVPDVLQAVNLDSILAVLLTGPELADSLLELHHSLREQLRQLARRSRYGRDSVQVHSVGYLFDVVEDVVKTSRKGGDVLIVKGGDEGFVEGAHDLVSVLIPQVLEFLDLPLVRREVLHVL